MELVDLEKVIDNVVLDIRYATANNFTGEGDLPVAKSLRPKTGSSGLTTSSGFAGQSESWFKNL